MVCFRLDETGRWDRVWGRQFAVPSVGAEPGLPRAPNPWHREGLIVAAGLPTAVSRDDQFLAVAIERTIGVVATKSESQVDVIEHSKRTVSMRFEGSALLSGVLEDGSCVTRELGLGRSRSPASTGR